MLFPLLLSEQTVPSLSYNKLKPLLNQKGDKIYVVNFWATWCAPCIKELPYFEVLDQREDVEVLLVSLDFPKHKESRLLPFIKKNKLQAKVVLLDDADENYWINDIHPNWSGALPATLIYTKKQRGFYEQSFTASKLDKILKPFNP
jgi:thiol-disulfide isomerase/thioredoxin